MKGLTSIIIKNSKKDNKIKSKKDLIILGISFLIVFGTISSIMVISSIAITRLLINQGRPYMFINVLITANYLMLLFNSIFSSLNTLYYSKDLKILLRMPIKSRDIVRSKIIQMIMSEYQMEIILLAIPIIVFGIMTNVSITFYLYSIIILLLLPVIPIIIASVINSVTMRITNSIKNKNKVMYITIAISVIIVSIISLNFNNIFYNSNEQFVLVKSIANAFVNYYNIEGVKSLISFVLQNILFYIIGIEIISKVYLKGVISATINSNKNKAKKIKNIKSSDCKKNKVWISYLKKEFLLIYRNPMFFIQCIIVPVVFSVLIAMFLLGMYGFFNKYNLNSIVLDLIKNPIGIAVIIIITQFIYMINFNSIIAVSKEGRNAVITKYIPVDYFLQFKIKTVIGEIINSLISIIMTIFYFLCTKDKIITLEIFIYLQLLNIIGEKIKLLIDLRSPQLNWTSEFMMLKQNTNVMNILFYTIIVASSVFCLGRLIENVQIFYIISFVILLSINIILNRYVIKKNSKLYEKVY